MFSKILDWFGFGSKGLSAGGDHAGHGRGDASDGHGHTHGVIDPSLTNNEQGIWAIKWSFVILAITASLQLVVVFVSGSVALLADTIHNVGDATTAIPLWAAFVLARRKPSKTFTYGLGRVEDLAGILIVFVILISAIVAGYQSINRLIHPQPIHQLGWLAAAGFVGFLGNEIVAVFRIRVGRKMNSAALIADGYHARTDGLTSLAVVVGAVGVWLGFPLADPLIGLLITITILGIVWQSARAVITRSLDGVEPGITEEIRHAAEHVPGVERVTEVKARWIGHELNAEVAIDLKEGVTLVDALVVAASLKREAFEHLPALANVAVAFERADRVSVMAMTAHGNAHHAPAAFHFAGKWSPGVLEIVDTPDGERMRLSFERPQPGLQAKVVIERSGQSTESLILEPTGTANAWQSLIAPAEPHEFSATIELTAGSEHELLAFTMSEPNTHQH